MVGATTWNICIPLLLRMSVSPFGSWDGAFHGLIGGRQGKLTVPVEDVEGVDDHAGDCLFGWGRVQEVYVYVGCCWPLAARPEELTMVGDWMWPIMDWLSTLMN